MLDAPIRMPLDVAQAGQLEAVPARGGTSSRRYQLEAVFEALKNQWGARRCDARWISTASAACACSWPATPRARSITGDTLYVDAGDHILN